MAIRIRNSKKDRQYNDQMKRGRTAIYKALHRKLKLELLEPHALNTWVHSDYPEGIYL